MNRRNFIQKTTFMSGAAGAVTMLPAFGSVMATTGCSGKKQTDFRSLIPTMMLNGTVSLSKPLLSPCQLSFRIDLARTRMASYPCNTMDFIMVDLEHPDNRYRKAHLANGDLTGRLLEFLCCSEGVDGKNDPRLDELYERILKQRKPSGFIGRYPGGVGSMDPKDDPVQGGAASKNFHGMIRYYDLTGDTRALEAALGLAEVLYSVKDEWLKAMKSEKGFSDIITWVGEPYARLYGITKDPRWMEFCAMIRDNIRPLEGRKTHSHGFLSTLRGMQVMTMVTGDLSWNLLPDKYQKIIVEKRYEMPDGNIPEFFPTSARNEGCSIADWMMLNLNQGLIHGDDHYYDKAERTFWNALAFNQLITGGFGHRRVASNGYGTDHIHEAWWCCTQDSGMGMADYARHTVTFRNDTIHVNFLNPGVFNVLLPGDKWAQVKINTEYPAKAEAIIEAENVPADIKLKIRVPSWIKNPKMDQSRSGNTVNINFNGDMGHRIEQINPGVIVTYGPLVLVPTRTVRVGSASTAETTPDDIKGYDPDSLPEGIPGIKLDNPPDADGFIKFPLCPPERPLPAFNYFDEGPGAPTWVEGAGVEVGLKFPGGEVFHTRFAPMCYNTSCLSLFETPVVFKDVEGIS